MTTIGILLDLDDTLTVDMAAADAAFLATGERARRKYGLDPEALHQAVRRRALELCRAAACFEYCRAIGMSSWEALWVPFRVDDPNVQAARAYSPTYRRESWARGLADLGVTDPAFAEELAGAFRDERRARHSLFPDARTTLEDLRGDYHLAMVTNGMSDIQRDKIEATDLGGYFDAIIISGEVGVAKPDARIFQAGLEELDVRPEAAVMVGNSLARDVAGAQQAGIRAIWLNRSGTARDGQVQPDAEIASLRELRGLLT